MTLEELLKEIRKLDLRYDGYRCLFLPVPRKIIKGYEDGEKYKFIDLREIYRKLK
jgi:hypothetical protein